ncbi:MAG: nitroreductase family protein [Candidatus Marinimicrobia bacterium]|nr:nitroreductase family protein [Candidatus Neomarinimicrobiota bacterium]
MEFLELVRQRQSVRKYTDRPISRGLIDKCIEAARLAPSANNSQPWSFIIIDDETQKNQLCDRAFSGVYQSNLFVKKAPVVIVVLTEPKQIAARIGGWFRNVEYHRIDVGIACEHLILQAEELGIGTCWLGWFNEKAVKKTLELPGSAKVDIIISMGYPADDRIREKKRKTLNEVRKYL